ETAEKPRILDVLDLEPGDLLKPLDVLQNLNQGSDASESYEGDHECDVEAVEQRGARFHNRGNALPGGGHEANDGREDKQREDERAEGMITKTFGEHSSQSATQAARESASEAINAGALFQPADRCAGAVRGRDGGEE